MKKFFITGTDTEVGKTFVASLFCKYLVDSGEKVGVFKPIESGVKNNPSPDFKILAKYANDRVKPLYTFGKPLAPMIASKIDGIEIDIRKVVSFIENDIKKHNYNIYVVEGAGGLFVPLTKKIMIIDLIKILDFEVILVARTNLGTVNHTLLSVEALRNRQIKINTIILNEIFKTPQEQIRDNISMIEMFGNIKVGGIVAYKGSEINFFTDFLS
jgi:dethiobiotin synthetase